MFTIGEFSKITGLPVKTLRFYHERGLLTPAYVDERTGYRHYDWRQIDQARVITELRRLEFSLERIAEMLKQCDDEADLLEFLQRQRHTLAERMRRYGDMLSALDQIIQKEKEARMATENSFNVEEKDLAPLLVAGVRMRGRYRDCGSGFAKIGRALGRYICGPALLLHYDHEYKEDDADFEACMPIRPAAAGKKMADGIDMRELPGGRCVSLMHKGPYEEMGRSYAVILKHVKDKGYEAQTPTREVYIKGPGMIFRGNPKKYLTEIQMLVRGPA